MNLVGLDRALRQLRLSGMAAVLDTRLRQAQTDKMTPIDLVSALVVDECSAVTIACWRVGTKPPGSAIPGAPSIRLISTSTRR